MASEYNNISRREQGLLPPRERTGLEFCWCPEETLVIFGHPPSSYAPPRHVYMYPQQGPSQASDPPLGPSAAGPAPLRYEVPLPTREPLPKPHRTSPPGYSENPPYTERNRNQQENPPYTERNRNQQENQGNQAIYPVGQPPPQPNMCNYSGPAADNVRVDTEQEQKGIVNRVTGKVRKGIKTAAATLAKKL